MKTNVRCGECPACQEWLLDPTSAPKCQTRRRKPVEQLGPRELCVVCATRERVGLQMCVLCRRSYDRMVASDDGTIASVIEWAAARARRFAKAKGGVKCL